MVKSPHDYPKIQFHVTTDGLMAALSLRADAALPVSAIARRDLDRYYVLLRTSLPRFSEPEALLLADVLKGTRTMPESAHLLWAKVSDAIKLDEVDQKWGVDGEALVRRLISLTPFETLAVADAVEVAWGMRARGTGPMAAALRTVGLCQEERKT